MTFTKLFSSITESTVWCENDQVRIVWITLLAMANKNGNVFASIPGLANRARVSVDSAREAIAKFLQPDRDSRTKDYEGRRIKEIDGGWNLLTYDKHRAIRDEEDRREYMAALMRKRRAEKKSQNVSNVSHGNPPLSQAEAEAEADSTDPLGGKVFLDPKSEKGQNGKAPQESGKMSASQIAASKMIKFVEDGEADRKANLTGQELHKALYDAMRAAAFREQIPLPEAKRIFKGHFTYGQLPWIESLDSQTEITFPPEDESWKSAITVEMAGQKLMEECGINDRMTYQVACNAIGSYLRHNKESNPIDAQEQISELWQEYKSSDIHAKCSVRNWLGDSANFLKPDTWRKKPKEEKQPSGRGAQQQATKTPQAFFMSDEEKNRRLGKKGSLT